MCAWSGGTYTKGNNSTGGWTGDASLGIGIEAGRHDTQDDDFATGINACLTKDGTNSPSANLPMGGYKHTGVADATAGDEYLSYKQLLDVSKAVTATGTEPNYAVTLTPAPTAYFTGMTFDFTAHQRLTSTGGTLNVNGLGAKDLKIKYSAARSPEAGEIQNDTTYRVTYDGTRFLIHNPTFAATNIDVTPVWGASGGPVSLSVNYDTNYRFLTATTVFFRTYCNLATTGAANFLTLQLPFTADADDRVVTGSGWVAGLTGVSDYYLNCHVDTNLIQLRIYLLDGSAFPIDANFNVVLNITYNIAS